MDRSASSSDWPAGPMEMARRIREHDWAATPLGAVEGWSERLKGAVEEMLASPLVGSLALGPERLHLYNDAAARLYEDRHPRALGRPLSETWPDAYATVAPFYERAFAGETVEVPTLALDVSPRGGEVWEAVLTPVRNEGGAVMAVRMTGFEVGAQLRERAAQARLRESEERQTFLLRLSDALRPLADPVAIMVEASEALGRHLGVGRCAYGEIDATGQFVTVHRDYHIASLPSVAGRYRIEDYGTKVLETLRRGETFVLDDVRLDPHLSDAETQRQYAAMRVRAAVVVPLVKSERQVAHLSLQQDSPRAWSPSELRLIEDVADRTWAAVEQARAEAELRASEARLSEAFKIQTVGVMFWGEGFGLTDTNEAFLRMTGFTREEAVGKTWQELTPPEFHAASWKAVGEVTTRGETTPYEKQFYRKDGSRWWGLFAARRVGDEVVEFVLDVTARKEAEERLRESEERFRAIVETATDYAIFTTDAEGRIVTWPRGAQEVFGWTAEEAVGQPMEITYTPEDRAAEVPAKERQEAHEKGHTPNVRWHVRKDGSRVFIDGVARPLLGPSDTVMGFVKVGQDVTERRAIEEALRESEARFRQFGDASSDVLWIRNAETLEWEYISPAFEEVYGTPRDSLLGRNHVRRWLELIVPEDHALALDHLRRVREGEHVLSAFRILRGDGEVRWIRDTGFPILDEDGRVLRVAGIGHDATEEVELHDRLRVLVAELQHRSRNLVTVVRGVTERTLATSETLDDFRARFRPRLEALGRVNSLLSRLEEGHRITFDQLLRTELTAHGVLDEEHNSQVRLSGPRGVPLRSATVQTFALALHELTTNALKYGALSRPEGRLEVSWTLVRGQGDERRLRVEWRESGMAVAVPDGQPSSGEVDGTPVLRRQGYGRELIERALPYQLKAQTRYELTPEGVRCTIVVPVSSTLDVAFSAHGESET